MEGDVSSLKVAREEEYGVLLDWEPELVGWVMGKCQGCCTLIGH
jgi:hypothetical protein